MQIGEGEVWGRHGLWKIRVIEGEGCGRLQKMRVMEGEGLDFPVLIPEAA